MSARTPSPFTPAHTGVELRLPWWAIALPALAFAALLLLISGPAQADPARGGSGALTHVLGALRETVRHLGL
ncbi:hypothetical protein [Streptomyces palmae]|uniref:Uncharacterized protein n=1 Tax=Streptomyces palmae TaxID=1701085 RepID=A0A4Z0HG61_9ACTN|nr:hypothetical protein [Streptomyces palmae]TGB14517.1 hypothetical protein E4099_08315 [Streptomyces palmae]